MDFEVLVLSVFNRYHVQSCPVWKHKPSRFLLMNGGEMGLVIYSPDKDITFWTANRVSHQTGTSLLAFFIQRTVTLVRVRVRVAMLNFHFAVGRIWESVEHMRWGMAKSNDKQRRHYGPLACRSQGQKHAQLSGSHARPKHFLARIVFCLDNRERVSVMAK